MATSSFQTQKQKPFHVLLTISLTFFLLLLNGVNSTDSLSFTFPNFTPDQPNLILQGDALVTSGGKLQLTKVENDLPVWNSLGRALYTAPVRIWDSSTGNVASFLTAFTFVIYAPDEDKTADGLAFFLAAPDSEPRERGGFLGLFSNENYNTSNQVVAVEFDTFSNPWDPSDRHIGIDVNSIKSTKTASWDFANGEEGQALITYQASTKLLVASVVYPTRQTSYIVSASVDLKSALPEWVRIGFSATTGRSESYIETHDITSWTFTSSYQSNIFDLFGDALKDNPHHASYVARDFM